LIFETGDKTINLFESQTSDLTVYLKNYDIRRFVYLLLKK